MSAARDFQRAHEEWRATVDALAVELINRPNVVRVHERTTQYGCDLRAHDAEDRVLVWAHVMRG